MCHNYRCRQFDPSSGAPYLQMRAQLVKQHAQLRLAIVGFVEVVDRRTDEQQDAGKRLRAGTRTDDIRVKGGMRDEVR